MPYALAVLLLLAACSDRAKPPPVPSGVAFKINPDRWPVQEATR